MFESEQPNTITKDFLKKPLTTVQMKQYFDDMVVELTGIKNN